MKAFYYAEKYLQKYLHIYEVCNARICARCTFQNWKKPLLYFYPLRSVNLESDFGILNSSKKRMKQKNILRALRNPLHTTYITC